MIVIDQLFWKCSLLPAYTNIGRQNGMCFQIKLSIHNCVYQVSKPIIQIREPVSDKNILSYNENQKFTCPDWSATFSMQKQKSSTITKQIKKSQIFYIWKNNYKKQYNMH